MRWHDGGEERRDDALAPVIPLFGRDSPAQPVASADEDVGDMIQAAENVLLRKLRTRQLSDSEARRVLHAQGVVDGPAEEIVERLRRHGYLDDARLAEQVAHTATTRKGQGRRAVTQSLTSRGIPREIADAVVAEMPDDEAERALDVARSRAGRVGDDPTAALRRLVGQLTRRGFSSGVAMSAARTALDERR